MDERTTLNPGYILAFPGMECKIEKVIGKGSNAIIYTGIYKDSFQSDLFHRILIKEFFPFNNENSVYRENDNSIAVKDTAKNFFELQKISFENGNKIHLAMAKNRPDKTVANINSFSLNNTLYTIMGFDGGKTLDKYDFHKTKQLRFIAELLMKILDAVDAFHSAGYLHLDISPDNILIIGNETDYRISLIDYNSVHAISEINSAKNLYCSTKEGYTPPEILIGNMSEVCKASDMYSVTAVLYRLITGSPLSFYQSLRKSPPNISKYSVVSDLPDTVCNQLMHIIRRGLSSVSQRYQNCCSMKKDIEELIFRIDSIGITHAALWEAEKLRINKILHTNPSLEFLLKGEIYPVKMITENECHPLYTAFSNQIDKNSAVICASAGMGKTTAFLHYLLSNCSSYSSLKPTVIYISLFDYNNSGEDFIKNRILENLKFQNNIKTMEDARNVLIKTFNQTITINNIEKKRFLLFLDGLNEAGGNTQPLIKEILSLSQLDGVCVIVSSRTPADNLPFDLIELFPLEESDIKDILSAQGLVYPESKEMQELLKTPLLLSTFCKTASDNHKQLSCMNKGELLDEYLSGLCEKEIQALAKNAPERWLIDASINFIFPYICAHISKSNIELDDKELLKTVKKCFFLLSSWRIAYILPRYIGHSKDIKFGSETPEQWYGETVIKILWMKTGLLIKEPDRGYKIKHQIIQDHMLKKYQAIEKQVRKQNVALSVLTSFFVAILVLGFSAVFSPDPFDEALSKSYLDSIVVSQVFKGNEISLTKDMLLSLRQNSSDFDNIAIELSDKISFHKNLITNKSVGSYEMTEKFYKNMIETGSTMSWSSEKVNLSDIKLFFEYAESVFRNYSLYADILKFIKYEPNLDHNAVDFFCDRLEEKIEADAALSDALFYSSCLIHLNEMKNKDLSAYEYYWKTIGENADLSDKDPNIVDKAAIEKLKKDCEDKEYLLNESEIFTIYRRSIK